jgi:hypothetical protein
MGQGETPREIAPAESVRAFLIWISSSQSLHEMEAQRARLCNQAKRALISSLLVRQEGWADDVEHGLRGVAPGHME